MNEVPAWLFMLSLPLALSLSLGGPGEDIVNERPPVSRSELESRWGVNCTAASQSVWELAALIRKTTGDTEVDLPLDIDSLLEELALCAVIDKSLWKGPGEPPDRYRKLHDVLSEWSACHEDGRSCTVYADLLVAIVYQAAPDE